MNTCRSCGKQIIRRKGNPQYCNRSCYNSKRPKMSMDKVFWEKVNKTSVCWLWTGYTSEKGYGVCFYEGKQIHAHRAAYMMLVGPILDGLEIDHKCRVRNCVNPDHLEPVKHIINIQRSPFFSSERRMMCKRGHVLTPDNVYLYKRVKFCRTCARASKRRSRARQKENE